MPEIEIPDPLPPAITPPRTVIEFLVDQDLEEFGDTGLVARTWHWVLHGGGPGPISHMDWSQFDGDGPPSAATLAAESTADEPPLYPRHPMARAQQGQVHLLAMHLRPGRRSTTTLPPVGNGSRTCRRRGRTGHRHHVRGLRPADRPAVMTAKASLKVTAYLKYQPTSSFVTTAVPVARRSRHDRQKMHACDGTSVGHPSRVKKG